MVAWSPDASTLATASWDDTVVLWDRGTWTPRATFVGHTAGITGLAWSPDGRTVAVADGAHKVYLWDKASGRRRAALAGQAGAVTELKWSPDGKWLAGVDNAGVDRQNGLLWDAKTGRLRAVLRVPQAFTLAWSPDSRTLAVGGGLGGAGVALWDARTARRVAEFPEDAFLEAPVQWSEDGKWIAVVEDGRMIALWDVATRSRRVLLPRHEGPPCGPNPLTWSPDGKLLATGRNDQDDGVVLWDPVTGQRLATLQTAPWDVQALSWSPDGQTLAVISFYAIQLWDARTRQQRKLLTFTDQPLTMAGPLVRSPDGKLFTYSDARAPLALREGRTGRRVAILRSHLTPASHLAWSPRGGAVAAASEEPVPLPQLTQESQGFVRVWDALSGRHRATMIGLAGDVGRDTLSPQPDPIYDLKWSPGGRQVAVATGQYGLQHIDGIPGMVWYRSSAMVWDAKTGRRRATMAAASAVVV